MKIDIVRTYLELLIVPCVDNGPLGVNEIHRTIRFDSKIAPNLHMSVGVIHFVEGIILLDYGV
jgi:hypothetical protein